MKDGGTAGEGILRGEGAALEKMRSAYGVKGQLEDRRC